MESLHIHYGFISSCYVFDMNLKRICYGLIKDLIRVVMDLLWMYYGFAIVLLMFNYGVTNDLLLSY